MKLTKAERQENKLKGVLRCEWCNKFTFTPRYMEIMSTHKGELMPAHQRQQIRRQTMFVCRRQKCRRSRPTR